MRGDPDEAVEAQPPGHGLGQGLVKAWSGLGQGLVRAWSGDGHGLSLLRKIEWRPAFYEWLLVRTAAGILK